MADDVLAWLAVSPPELAFLAAAEERDVTAFDHVSIAGSLLRSPEVRAVGAEAFARRVSSAGEAAATALALLVDACRLLGAADNGCVVQVAPDGAAPLHVVTVWHEGLVAQLWSGEQVLAVRPVEAGRVVEELRAVVATHTGSGEALTLSWSAEGTTIRRRWCAGTIEQAASDGTTVIATGAPVTDLVAAVLAGLSATRD